VIMASVTHDMPFLSSIGLSITTRCPVACAHCIVEAGPKRRDEMSLADAEVWIRQAATYRRGYIRSIVITGGEPFFSRGLLERILQCSESNGLVPAVVTNAYWAGTRSDARDALSRLPQIRMLAISTDIYHQRSIPLGYINNAVSAAEEMGIRYNIATCAVDERDPRYLDLLDQLCGFVDKSLIKEYPVFPAGRAKKTIRPSSFVKSDEYPPGPCTGADFPTIFPDGRVVGCMGMLMELPDTHHLLYGNLHTTPLEKVLDTAEMNVALHFLRIWGPAKFVEMLKARGLQDHLQGPYLKKGYCLLCHKLLSDELLRDEVNTFVQDPVIIDKVAFARVYYLNEAEMAQRLRLADNG
jgi:hypothetical protein